MSRHHRGWETALARASQITAADRPPALCSDKNWDYVGVRCLLAIVLQALAEQTSREVDDVPLEDVLQHCERGAPHVRSLAVLLVGEELAYSLDTAPDAVVPPADAAPLDTWLWLTRLWPAPVPDDIDGLPPRRPQRWDGMTRSIARGSDRAAVDLLTHWAANAVATAVTTD